MSLPYIIRPRARGDIDAAYAWYEGMRPGRGDEFLNELRDRLDEVCQAPDQFGRVRGEVRAAPLHRSRYIIYFRIEPNQVTVLAVQHARVNPRSWRGRT